MGSTDYSYMITQDGAKIRIGHWVPLFSTSRKNVFDVCSTIVLLQGRASFIEKFEEIIYGLTARGFDVWALDWRGQGVSSRLVGNQSKGHIDSYDTYLNDLHQLMVEYVLPMAQGPVVALAQSMGGHLVLRYMHDHPEFFHGGVLTAPMMDVNTGAYPKAIARFLAKAGNKLGFSESYVFGHSEYHPTKEPFEDNLLTHDRERFFKHRRMQLENPYFNIGGVTFGWLDATFDSISMLLDKNFLEKIQIPLLLIAAGEEEVVDNEPLKKVCEWLPSCQMKIYPQARHQILAEIDPILEEFWRDFDQFFIQNFVPDQKDILRPQPVQESTEGRLIEAPELSGMERLNTALPQNFNRFKSDL
jgi:lysophospholipase